MWPAHLRPDKVSVMVIVVFRIMIFMSNTLGKGEDVLQGLSLGTHHASLSASAVSQINTRTAIFDLPYLFEDRAAVQTFAESPAGEMLADGFDGSGMVLAAMWDNGFRQITNAVRPIVVPADLAQIQATTLSALSKSPDIPTLVSAILRKDDFKMMEVSPKL